MPLDTADTFPTDTDTDPDTPTKTYPPPPPLAPLSFLLGYTPADRTRYTTLQATATSRLLSLPLTPTELAGLAYYDGIFYAYQSYGDVIGTSLGALLGFALRSRKPGRIPTAIARIFNVNPRYVAVTLRVGVFGSLGMLYGMTTASVQALNRMRKEQKDDPEMGRVVAARARKLSALEREVRARAFGAQEAGAQRGGEGERERDEQSLGGMEVAEYKRRSDEDVVNAERTAFPFGRPSEAVAAARVESQGERQGERGDDPFLLADEKEGAAEAPVRGGWRNAHSSTGESTWERLRKGQRPQPQQQQQVEETQPQQTSPWPQRAPMKGFGAPAAGSEPKTDSFSFSSTAEDRELAKAQAQKEFDESVERERRSGGGDGYSEGDQGRAGRW
ncbi:uncharacterized protein LAJ45_01290 [Morchella importuna]|uniref:uncharacterized protein n=1 Tax=Morchella importuna TaxID=1174673 RepID=UPI001E8D74F3|nr:uncharacterized protein LAJ45_01290 [Morchella importuna]KAH8154759.1 hypothetical protein LAJ45_01290 [Morchella importuna]